MSPDETRTRNDKSPLTSDQEESDEASFADPARRPLFERLTEATAVSGAILLAGGVALVILLIVLAVILG